MVLLLQGDAMVEEDRTAGGASTAAATVPSTSAPQSTTIPTDNETDPDSNTLQALLLPTGLPLTEKRLGG